MDAAFIDLFKRRRIYLSALRAPAAAPTVIQRVQTLWAFMAQLLYIWSEQVLPKGRSRLISTLQMGQVHHMVWYAAYGAGAFCI